MTSIEDIKSWFDRAPKNATHMIVVCDTFDWEDYPVYVLKGQDVHTEVANRNGANMQKIMEVYNLKMPFEKNCAKGDRVFNY